MDEIMAAIDAYIARKVEETFESKFRARFMLWVMDERPTFDLLIKEAVQDKPWFDETVSNLVAENTPVPATPNAGVVVTEELKRIDMTMAANRDAIRAFIKNDDNFREFLADVVGDECYDRIRDMSFSVSVD